MIRLPSIWQVDQFKVCVELCDAKALDNGNLGQYNSEKLLILIYRHAHPQAQAECLLHELWHVGYDLRFGPDSQPDEEDTVRFCTQFMLRLIRDNPEEMAILLDAFDQPFPNLVSGVWTP